MKILDWMFSNTEASKAEPVAKAPISGFSWKPSKKAWRSVMAPPGDVITCPVCGHQSLDVVCSECKGGE